MDAADRQWHLTSPAPYDPPLTYGGWRQAHALGARIATILHQLETTLEFQLPRGALKHPSIPHENGHGHSANKPADTPLRKHKVIIHTSPFLRCIQTSIGISGGMAEAQGPSGESIHSPYRHTMHSAHPLHSGSPHIRAMDHWNSPQLSAISEPAEESEDTAFQAKANGNKSRSKPRLRVDAFLGEWLSPGYYEDITHPPDSRMMVATAKANLLHEKNYEAVKQSITKALPSTGNFPGGWGSGKTTPTDDDDGPLARLPKLDQSLPRLNRSGSHSSAGSLAHRRSHVRQGSGADLALNHAHDEYALPVPSYAISSVAPIPPGYVAYAKNTCLDVDYQWDSMRAPHEWGDGGVYGEEWSSMHRRFRRGLQDMILWYRGHGNEEDATTVEVDGNPDVDEDEDTDTVLVLVTHSAGCNALIGALTNQPVLLDAGMASLTMAVRKSAVNGYKYSSDSPASPTSYRRRSSVDSGISEDYDVKIIASTDHLRTGSMASSIRSSRASSPGASGQRNRATTLASTPSHTVNANEGAEIDGLDDVGGLKRSATAATPRSTGLWSKPTSSTSNGLWNKPADKISTSQAVHDHSPLRESTTIKKVGANGTPEKKEPSTASKPPPLPVNGGEAPVSGLWGSPPPTPSSEREKGPKRRWTLHEH